MKLKNKFYWIVVVTVVGLLSSLWFLVQSKADDPDSKSGNQVFLPLIGTEGNTDNAPAITPNQISVQANAVGGRIDAFTFYIPFPAEVMDDQFNIGQTDFITLTNVPISTTISIAVNRPGSVIYYDQWEDGYEDDTTVPAQTSTQVWGDNNAANGIPPGFGTDQLDAGDVILLQNSVTLPRNLSQLFFDGNDTLTSVGGSIAVSLTFWTDLDDPGILFTDAWELYPTSRWGNDYDIPIGEDLAPIPRGSAPGANQRGGFELVGLYVQAVQNNTVLNVDLDGAGPNPPLPPVTLNQGGTFFRQGDPNGIDANSTLVGATIRASAPVQVTLFASNPVSSYEARGFTLVSQDQWTTDLIAPRSDAGDFWIYNPDSNPLLVDVFTSINPLTQITVPGRSTIKFPPAGLSLATGTRFVSTDPTRHLYGLGAFDPNQTRDWGHSLLPTANLTTQVLVGLGIGNNNRPPDGDQSRIYVTALNDATVYVDFDNDGTEDITRSVPALAEVEIIDPDHNLTGAFLWATNNVTGLPEPFAAVWGQDPGAIAQLPSIDAGTAITPLPALAILKTFDLVLDQDCNGIISVRDTVRFNLDYFSNSKSAINDVNVEDDLPAALGYVPGTTTLNGQPVSDGGGSTPFILDEGGLNAGTVNPQSVSSITYNTIVNNTSGVIINGADIDASRIAGGAADAEIVIPTGSASPVMEITTALVDPTDGIVLPGQTITVNLAITNTSPSSNVIELPVEYNFNDSELSFVGASITPDNVGTGVLSWNDLAPAGNLAPGQVVNIVLNFTVQQIPVGNNTNLTALINDARRQDSAALLRCRADAVAALSGPPTPTPTPTLSPTPRPPHNGNPQSTPQPTTPPSSNLPTPTPAAIAAAVPAATPSGQLPVLFLPETGTKEAEQTQAVVNLIIALVFVTAGAAAFKFWRKSKQVKLSASHRKDS